MRLARPFPLVALVAATVFASGASAQWMWKDEAGHVIASDQPPPPDTPAARILKAPRTRTSPTPKPPEPSDATKAPEAAKTTADRELDFKQRQKEQAEAQKKNDEEAAKAKAMQENCATVRSNLAGLQAGGRIARTNDRGEKFYLDDAQRQGEIARAQGQISQYCK